MPLRVQYITYFLISISLLILPKIFSLPQPNQNQLASHQARKYSRHTPDKNPVITAQIDLPLPLQNGILAIQEIQARGSRTTVPGPVPRPSAVRPLPSIQTPRPTMPNVRDLSVNPEVKSRTSAEERGERVQSGWKGRLLSGRGSSDRKGRPGRKYNAVVVLRGEK
jgi:hypothetical protein